MECLRIHQLTKEMVAEELRLLGDPCLTASAVVRKTLISALATSAGELEQVQIIEDVVKGAMTALLLADLSLTRGTMMILAVVLDVTQSQIDPTMAMGAALKGVADLRRFISPTRLHEIRVAIESKYMGAGEVFSEYSIEPVPPGTRQQLPTV